MAPGLVRQLLKALPWAYNRSCLNHAAIKSTSQLTCRIAHRHFAASTAQHAADTASLQQQPWKHAVQRFRTALSPFIVPQEQYSAAYLATCRSVLPPSWQHRRYGGCTPVSLFSNWQKGTNMRSQNAIGALKRRLVSDCSSSNGGKLPAGKRHICSSSSGNSSGGGGGGRRWRRTGQASALLCAGAMVRASWPFSGGTGNSDGGSAGNDRYWETEQSGSAWTHRWWHLQEATGVFLPHRWWTDALLAVNVAVFVIQMALPSVTFTMGHIKSSVAAGGWSPAATRPATKLSVYL